MPASAISIILDPSEVADSRTELNINSGAIRVASEGPDWGDAAIAAALADRKFGSVPVGYRIPNRIVTIPLIVQAVSGTTFNQAQTKLQQKVARFQDEGGWLKRVSSNGTTKLYADVVNAALTFPDPRFQDVEGSVVLTLECLPDFYGSESSAARLVSAIQRVDADNSNLSTLLLADPDASTGTPLDRSANAYTGSLSGGATVVADALGPEDALSLTGSAYGSFAAPTRRNYAQNPRAATSATAGSVGQQGTPTTFERVTSLPGTPPPGATTGWHIVAAAGGDGLISSFTGHANDTPLAVAAYVYVVSLGGANGVKVQHDTGALPSTVISTTGQWIRATPAAANSPAGSHNVRVRSDSAGTPEFYVTYLFGEPTTLGAQAGAHFDATGYVNASGEWVPSAGIECGALGTLHASASDKGPFGNGKTLTFVDVVQVSADAATSVGQTLFGSDLSTNGTRFDLYNSAGTRQARLQIGGTTYTWTLTADEIAATAAGQTFAYRLEFNETANTATLQINGLPAVQKTSVTAQHAAGQTAVQLGAYASGSSPLPGKVGPGALFVGALTADEWERIANAVGYSSDDHDSLVLTEPNVPGDYPARSRYTFTDTGSQARQAVLIASQSRTYDSAATAALAYEAEALTPLDSAAIATKTGAHGGASNNVVAHTTISPSWVGVLSTEHDTLGHLTHWGSYRVLARVYADAEVSARLEYSVGDSATRRTNDAVTVPGDGGFYIADFGEVRLSRPAVGTQQWLGAFFAKSEDSGVTFGIDKVWIAPTESLTVCRARQGGTTSASSLPLSADYRDSFSQTSGNLNGKTPDRGGAWSTAGSTTDFTIDTTNGYAKRTTTSDAGVRVGVVGSALTACYAAVDMASSVWTTDMYQGLVLRYVDSSNYILAIHYYNAGSRVDIIQVIGGTPTILLERTVSAQPTSVFRRIAATVSASGLVGVQFDGQSFSAVCTAAATGGTLATGKVGIVDYHPSSTAANRYWDNFIGSAVTSDSACRSGGVLSARFDGAWRETSTAGIYAPVYVEGVNPRAPASGLEARTIRTLVLPSAGDFDTLSDTDPLAFSVASHHAPCFLFAPEE